MNGRGRPEKLTDELKRWIATRQKGLKKKLKAPALQKEIRLILEKRVREEAPDQDWSEKLLQSEIDRRLPGDSSIQKYLNEIDPDKLLSLDTPWHLGTLGDYPMSAEAVSYILALQKYAKHNNYSPLTIRHALWASRLYPNFKMKEKDLHDLWCYSGGYAWYDHICAISGTNFDSTILDEALIGLREWRDVMFSLIAPIELEEGRCSPEVFAWLLNKTKDDPNQRAKLYEILHINAKKEGEK